VAGAAGAHRRALMRGGAARLGLGRGARRRSTHAGAAARDGVAEGAQARFTARTQATRLSVLESPSGWMTCVDERVKAQGSLQPVAVSLRSSENSCRRHRERVATGARRLRKGTGGFRAWEKAGGARLLAAAGRLRYVSAARMRRREVRAMARWVAQGGDAQQLPGDQAEEVAAAPHTWGGIRRCGPGCNVCATGSGPMKFMGAAPLGRTAK
jgi:hypothetical protein